MQERKVDVDNLRVVLMILYLRHLAFKASVIGLINIVQQQSLEVTLRIEDAQNGLCLYDILIYELPYQRFSADPVLIDPTDVFPSAQLRLGCDDYRV